MDRESASVTSSVSGSICAWVVAAIASIAAAVACTSSPPAIPGQASGVMAGPDIGTDASEAGGEDGQAPTGPYDGGDPPTLMMPVQSFQNDVMPIFTHSCDFTSCHSNPSGMPLEYLGDSGFGTMPPPYSFSMAVYTSIVSRPTVEAPSLMFVNPGNPTASYLLRKIDNGLGDVTCVAGNPLSMMAGANGMACGGPMPASGSMLSPEQIDIIRRWIAQGAKYN